MRLKDMVILGIVMMDTASDGMSQKCIRTLPQVCSATNGRLDT